MNTKSDKLCYCALDLPQRKGGIISQDGCCGVSFRLAPAALACAVLVCLQDTRLVKACTYATITWERWLILTVTFAILPVIKGHLEGLKKKKKKISVHTKSAFFAYSNQYSFFPQVFEQFPSWFQTNFGGAEILNNNSSLTPVPQVVVVSCMLINVETITSVKAILQLYFERTRFL